MVSGTDVEGVPMATMTQMQTRTDEEFAKLSDDEIIERYFEKDFNYDGMAGLTDRELDDWINDYVSHIPETHNLKKYEVPCMLNKKLKRIIRDRI
jgi:hypothetical protein